MRNIFKRSGKKPHFDAAAINILKYKAKLLDNIHDAICVADGNNKIIYWNNMACKMFGWSEKEAIGQPYYKIFKTVVSNSIRKNIVREMFKDDYYDGDIVYYHKDGRKIYTDTHIKVLRGQNNKINQYIISLRDITEQKRMEETFREYDIKYRMLFNSIDQGFYIIDMIFDIDGRPIDIFFEEGNKAALKILGRDLTGKRLTDINPNTEPFWYETFGEVAMTGKSIRLERYTKGNKKWYSFYIFKMGDEDNFRVGSIFYDITERKNRELNTEFLKDIIFDLNKPQAFNLSLLDTGDKIKRFFGINCLTFADIDQKADSISIIYNKTGTDPAISYGTLRLSDFVNEECLHAGMNGRMIVINDTEEHPHFKVRTKSPEISQKRSIIIAPITRDGALVFVVIMENSSPRIWRTDEIDLVSELSNRIFSIIERTRADEALRESEKKYRMLFNSIDEGFCIIKMIFDSKGKPVDFRFIEINPAFECQSGLSNVKGMLMRDMYPEVEDYWLETVGKVALTGEPIRFINGTAALKKWFNVYAFKIDNGEVENVAILFKDITEIINEKNELEKNLKIQDEIFANISHELKTPLNVIFSTNQLMELMLKSNSVEENRSKFLKSISVIKQNCYRFTKLINNIIDLSKIDSGFYKLNLSNENIVAVVESIVQSVSDYIKDKGLSIIFDTSIEEKIIACDPEKIERIILNLISNAIKFSNPEDEISVNVTDNDKFVEIAVKDSGVGIDRIHLDSIFKRYHQVDKTLTRNTEGCGIGLSLVKSIVDLHGGKISVESKVGKGSIFKVELPVRIIEETIKIEQTKAMNKKIERINIEFSDIYH